MPLLVALSVEPMAWPLEVFPEVGVLATLPPAPVLLFPPVEVEFIGPELPAVLLPLVALPLLAAPASALPLVALPPLPPAPPMPPEPPEPPEPPWPTPPLPP